MADKKKRPDRTTMEGMLWKANEVLDAALDPKAPGIPKELFEKCHGIVLMSIVSVGFIFTGHGGTGVMMAKKPDGSWSAPSAVGVEGFGGGAVAGAQVEDVLIFIMDEETMKDFGAHLQTRIGGEAFITLGKLGRERSIGLDAPKKGSVTVSFNKGVFGGFGLKMGTLGPREAQNKKFYGGVGKQSKILFENAVTIPPDSGIPELHKKLNLLAQGKTHVPTAAEQEKSEHLRVAAVAAGEAAKKEQPDIQYVDKSEEMAVDKSEEIA